ncbi:MAG: hypothetical protein AMXMBFR61_04200 [Fimbriimonadales bacterium]
MNGLTRYLVWEGDELLLEVAPGTGAVMTRHVWGAGGYQGYFRNEGSTPTRLALRDGLGHVRGLMNTSKVITDRYVYDAYGNDVAPNLHNTTEGNSLRFRWNGSYGYRTLYLLSGQQSTNTATVMHVGARHYSPSLRRWLQRDPVGLGGGSPNLYQYCCNSPIGAVDPMGLQMRPPVGHEERIISLALGLIRQVAPEIADDLRSILVLVDDDLELGARGTIRDGCIVLKPHWTDPTGLKTYWHEMRSRAVEAASTIVHEYYHLRKQAEGWAKLISSLAYHGALLWATLGVMFSPLNDVEQVPKDPLAAYEKPAYSFSVRFLDILAIARPDLIAYIRATRAEICAAFEQHYGLPLTGGG